MSIGTFLRTVSISKATKKLPDLCRAAVASLQESFIFLIDQVRSFTFLSRQQLFRSF
ncbi:hypothetical protein Hanom_Chr17g01532971 [Helianthus anomalus]